MTRNTATNLWLDRPRQNQTGRVSGYNLHQCIRHSNCKFVLKNVFILISREIKSEIRFLWYLGYYIIHVKNTYLGMEHFVLFEIDMSRGKWNIGLMPVLNFSFSIVSVCQVRLYKVWLITWFQKPIILVL